MAELSILIENYLREMGGNITGDDVNISAPVVVGAKKFHSQCAYASYQLQIITVSESKAMVLGKFSISQRKFYIKNPIVLNQMTQAINITLKTKIFHCGGHNTTPLPSTCRVHNKLDTFNLTHNFELDDLDAN